MKRSINRSSLKEEELFDAFAEAGSLPARIASRFIALLEKRTADAAFHPNAPQSVLDLDPRVFALARESMDGKSRVLCLANVSGESVPLSPRAAGFSAPLRDLVGGRTFAEDAEATLRPYEVLWLKPA